MKAGKLLRRAALGLLLVIVLLPAAGYVLLYWQPRSYRPVRLDAAAQAEVAGEFIQKVADFHNAAGRGDPFTWTLTAEQINRTLASINAISAVAQQPVDAPAEMARAGIADPAVALDDGVLTLMAREIRGGRIVSIDLAFEFDPAGRVAAGIRGARVGLLPVPPSWVDDQLAEARRKLTARLEVSEQAQGRIGPVSLQRMTELLRRVLEMLGGEYVSTDLSWELFGSRLRARVEAIEITDGVLTLRVRPLPASRGEDATDRRAPAGG